MSFLGGDALGRLALGQEPTGTATVATASFWDQTSRNKTRPAAEWSSLPIKPVAAASTLNKQHFSNFEGKPVALVPRSPGFVDVEYGPPNPLATPMQAQPFPPAVSLKPRPEGFVEKTPPSSVLAPMQAPRFQDSVALKLRPFGFVDLETAPPPPESIPMQSAPWVAPVFLKPRPDGFKDLETAPPPPVSIQMPEAPFVMPARLLAQPPFGFTDLEHDPKAIAVYEVGSASSATGSLVITVVTPIPAGSLIVAHVDEDFNSATPGTFIDQIGNVYKRVAAANNNGITSNGFGTFFYTYNSIALAAGKTITYIQRGGPNSKAMSVLFATNILTTYDPLDGLVTAVTTGSSSTPSVTGGTPAAAGELIVAGVSWTGAAGDTFTPDKTHANFAAPPDFVAIDTGSEIAGGSVVNFGSAATTFAPTITSNPWSARIIGFFAASTVFAPGNFMDLWWPLVRLKPRPETFQEFQSTLATIAPPTFVPLPDPAFPDPVKLKQPAPGFVDLETSVFVAQATPVLLSPFDAAVPLKKAAADFGTLPVFGKVTTIIFQAFDTPVVSRRLQDWQQLPILSAKSTIITLAQQFERPAVLRPPLQAGIDFPVPTTQVVTPLVFLEQAFFLKAKLGITVSDWWAALVPTVVVTPVPVVLPPGGGGHRRKKKHLPVRPIWDRPLVTETKPAPVVAPRQIEFPPPLPLPEPTLPAPPMPLAGPNISPAPYPSPVQAQANIQDARDAQDALDALGLMFHDDMEVGDALAALAAAGII